MKQLSGIRKELNELSYAPTVYRNLARIRSNFFGTHLLYMIAYLISTCTTTTTTTTTLFSLWLCTPIHTLAASIKLPVSLQLLDLGLLGRVIS
jgi:hypothetical protein